MTHDAHAKGRTGFFKSDDPEEVYADEFALALLMPEKEFRKHYRKEKGHPVFLGLIFGVPPEYVTERIKGLGLR